MTLATAAVLRPATPADLNILVHHRQRMWEDMGTLAPGAADPSEGNYRSWLASLLFSGDIVGWVAEAKQAPVASGLLWFQPWHPRPMVPRGTIPYLLSVFVEPDWRGRGIARGIAQLAIDAAVTAGHPRIALHASEAGRPLYAAMGFRPGKEMILEFSTPP